jgi:hypothetical protein
MPARSPESIRPTEPKVEQGELSNGEQQHVARMRIGVEDAIDHHLAQQSVEQGAGEGVAVTDLLVGRDRAQWAGVCALPAIVPFARAARSAGSRVT